MIDTKGWRISPQELPGCKAEDWNPDFFIEVTDGQYGVYVYNLDELRMGDYYGKMAVFQQPASSPVPVVCSDITWIKFSGIDSALYLSLPDCLILRIPAYVKDATKPDMPFLVIKPKAKTFAFIEWNDSSIYYTFEGLDRCKIQVRELHPKELTRYKVPHRTNEVIDLGKLNWHSLALFDAALFLYHQEPTLNQL